MKKRKIGKSERISSFRFPHMQLVMQTCSPSTNRCHGDAFHHFILSSRLLRLSPPKLSPGESPTEPTATVAGHTTEDGALPLLCWAYVALVTCDSQENISHIFS